MQEVKHGAVALPKIRASRGPNISCSPSGAYRGPKGLKWLYSLSFYTLWSKVFCSDIANQWEPIPAWYFVPTELDYVVPTRYLEISRRNACLDETWISSGKNIVMGFYNVILITVIPSWINCFISHFLPTSASTWPLTRPTRKSR